MKGFSKFPTIIASVVAVLVLGSCTTTASDPPLYETLTKDPVMEMNFENTNNLEWLLTERSNLAPDVAPHLDRCLSFDDGVEPAKLMLDVLNYAQTEGWSRPDAPTLDTKSSIVAFKKDNFGDRMTLIVTTDGFGCEAPAKEANADNTLRISITY